MFSRQENVLYFLPILDYWYFGTGLVREEPLDYVHTVGELSIRNDNLIELKKF